MSYNDEIEPMEDPMVPSFEELPEEAEEPEDAGVAHTEESDV